tara:strand:- start:124 stop:333 length:210 start_codon:yes stop_codon:yes gene_type:complete
VPREESRLKEPAKSNCRVKLCMRVVFSAYTRKPQPSARVYLVRVRVRAKDGDEAGGLRLGMRCLRLGLR